MKKEFFVTITGPVVYLLIYVFQIAPHLDIIGVAVMTFTYSVIIPLVYSISVKGLGQSCPPSVHRQMAAYSVVGMITSIHAVWAVKDYARPSIAAWAGLIMITLTLAGCMVNLWKATRKEKLIFIRNERFDTLYGVIFIAVVLSVSAFVGFDMAKRAFGF
ncbi:TPA: hypothetical protein DEP94_03890 [Candidatus Nomurabacteria bacterium]|nr:hypothetical protein [Candidatus Nomurabacteria bacterium]